MSPLVVVALRTPYLRAGALESKTKDHTQAHRSTARVTSTHNAPRATHIFLGDVDTRARTEVRLRILRGSGCCTCAHRMEKLVSCAWSRITRWMSHERGAVLHTVLDSDNKNLRRCKTLQTGELNS